MSENPSEVAGDDPIDVGAFIDFLEFELGGHACALELGYVGQIVRDHSMTRIPRAPSPIRGGATVDGDIAVIVDTHALVGLDRPLTHEEDGIVVVLRHEAASQPVGLELAAVDGIEWHPVETLESVGETGLRPPADDQWFKAVLRGEADSDGP
ncbi:MAG: chemotaxis protein CheW, partial [Halobacteriota archaeon]